jgi:hypothetical protein
VRAAFHARGVAVQSAGQTAMSGLDWSAPTTANIILHEASLSTLSNRASRPGLLLRRLSLVSSPR